MTDDASPEPNETDIAIVGMAARLPGARNISEYWNNLKNGVESVVFFTEEELLASGESPKVMKQPNYVPATAIMNDVEMFDAEFFGFSPKEAAIMDPQHRHLIEVSWEALENAGHPPEKFDGSIGIFGGVGMGAYFTFNILTNRELVESVGLFLLRHTSNDKDFLVTRIAYLLNLTGPAVNVQTACSTSLVATHMACQSLLSGECDMALAGGVTIEIPHRRGYLYHEGEVLSPDGHCHAFDHRGKGTVFGSGAGVVVLRRLVDALADGDHIHAVIRGSAINNDGSAKVGYLAPSVDGQAAAMTEAHMVAGVTADTIDYIECHGTGTYVGDPIEVQALTEAFRQTTDEVQFCRIGSVKTNIGHLDTAAGVASLIKASLALQHGQMPPSLNFEKPNPGIDFQNSPFIVNETLHEWTRRKGPRRAAVNSLGVGGTNAHVVVEEAPAVPMTAPASRSAQLLAVSARTKKALDAASLQLAEHLRAHPEQSLADIAWTLRVGRRDFDQRRVLAASSHDEAAALLEAADPQRVFSHKKSEDRASIVFMFPGGGAQYPRMGAQLHAHEPVFRRHLDRGLELLSKKHGLDLRPLLLADPGSASGAAADLEKTPVQLPALFIVEYALAELWISWGVKPDVMIGHSMGENTAAVLSGVMTFEEALGLVVLRGRLVDRVAEGAMLSVPMSAEKIKPLLGDDLDLAIVNAPELTVVSGTIEAIESLERRLAVLEIEPRRLRINVAGHSRMLEPILEEFGAYLKQMRLSKPKIPFVSNRTGTWITDREATDPQYWVDHFRKTIHFAEGIGTILATPGRVLIEVGPGRILGSLARQHALATPSTPTISSLRHADLDVSDEAFFLTAYGRLWATGVAVDAERPWADEKRRRVELPSYAWQHQPYFIEPGRITAPEEDLRHLARDEDPEDWYWAATWQPRPDASSLTALTGTWLVFIDDTGVGRRIVERLRERGCTVIVVHQGDAYWKRSDLEYVVPPERGAEGYLALVQDLVKNGHSPSRIVHLWMVAREDRFRAGSNLFHHNQERGFYSLLHLAQALGDESLARPIHVTVVSTDLQKVGDEPLKHPEKACLLGPVKVMPRELPGVTCSSIDIQLERENGAHGLALLDPRVLVDRAKALTGAHLDGTVDALLHDLASPPRNFVAAHRGEQRFEQIYERKKPDDKASGALKRVREGGVYFITGGVGGLGLVMAEHLARTAKAKLVLTSRQGVPAREAWDEWLETQGPSDRTSKKIVKLRNLEALGAEVLVYATDVTDIEGMREALAGAKARFGRVNGVIHTAGVVKDGLIALKTLADCEEVFTPKVHGTMVIDRLFADEDLDFMVLFSSTSTAIAPVGQVDYVAANAFLNSYAMSREGERTYVVAVGWGIWNEVGLAAETMMGGQEEALAPEKPTSHPLFEARGRDRNGQTVLIGRMSPATSWLLDQHRTGKGHALIPGTGFVELAAGALREYGEQGAFELSDLYFFRPLAVADDDEPREVRVRLRTTDEGYAFEVRSKRMLEGRAGWELHAQGSLLMRKLEQPARLPIVEIEARCTTGERSDPAGMRVGQEAHVRFGSRWRVLNHVRYGDGEAIAELSLPAAHGSDLEAGYLLHPALLDISTGYAMELIAGYQAQDLWVPVSYGSMKVFGTLPRQVKSWARNHGDNRIETDFARFDVTITDLEGNVVVEVTELALKRMSAAVDFAGASRPSPSEIEMEPRDTDGSHLSPAEQQLRRNIEQGILPKEGQAALSRILGTSRRPVVYVSSLDVGGLMKQAALSSTEVRDSSTKFARPELDSEYAEPRDDVERTLVGMWEELLGVDQVGVNDSFFDLGGHSLIAVRLFAQIKKAYQVDYPISVLFEAPTIDRCASLIKDSIGHEAPTGDAANGAKPEAASPAARRRYTHLVAMHPGEAANKRPYFLVAGMFGNVVNLRHLAHLIGHDRPFYGVQARGLYGDLEPHATFEEMAKDYLAEIRSVQPRGPYLFGGFSGGGITCHEMAQQLLREGEKVDLLIMLDSLPPQPPQLTRKDKLRMHVQRLQRQGAGYVAQWGQDRFHWEFDKLRKRLNSPAEEGSPAAFHNEAIEHAFRSACARYDIKPYPGKIHLFRPKQEIMHEFEPGKAINDDRDFVFQDNGWGEFAREVEVYEVMGDHDSMVLEPTVRVLAARMKKLMDQADAALERAAPRPAARAP